MSHIGRMRRENPRRQTIAALSWAAAVVVLAAGCTHSLARPAATLQSPRRPNVIFIMADDLGYGDLGCYGQRKIRTPFLDQMAAEGLRFTQFYSGHPVCAPSRGALMTGLHTGHAFIRGNYAVPPEGQLPLPADTMTVARRLRDAGYATAGIGKWGLGGPGSTGHPNDQGFDEWYGHLCQRLAHSYYPEYVWRNRAKVVLEGNDPVEQKGRYVHDLFTEEALRFVQASHGKPFFLYLAYTIPHLEFAVPEDSLKEYAGRFPETPFEGTGTHQALPDRPDVPFVGNYRPQKAPRAAYAAMITRMDRDIGRLLAVLKDRGLERDTLVLFTSDNGAYQGLGADAEFFGSNGAFRGQKSTVYEGGIRVPLIARWPGTIRAGQVSDHVGAHWDFFATALDLAGIQDSVPPDSVSYLPTLLGRPGQKEHEYLYWEFRTNGKALRALRSGKWKAVQIGGDALELYDLDTDPSERRSVSEENRVVARSMNDRMTKARTDSPHFPLFESVRPAARVSSAE